MRTTFKKAKKQKRIAVLFSGGLDSTYLIYKNLKEGHRVFPFYIQIANNVNKSRIEMQQVVRLYEEFKNEFGITADLNHPHLITKIDVWQGGGYDGCGLKFNQIPIWLFGLQFIGLTSYDEIQIGYVANDDAIPYLDLIKQTYESMTWLHNREENVAKLTFPISAVTKYEMLDTLPSTYKELIFSCENPTVEDTTFVRHTKAEILNQWGYNNFLEQFLGNKDQTYVHFKPCGNCVPCQKILNSDQLSSYFHHQPIFKTLKTKQVIRSFEAVLDESRYNEHSKELVLDLFHKRTVDKDWIPTSEEIKNHKSHWEKQYQEVELLQKKTIETGEPIYTAVQTPRSEEYIQESLRDEIRKADLKMASKDVAEKVLSICRNEDYEKDSKAV